MQGEGELELCIICKTEMRDEEELASTACSHNFHRVCIEDWFVNHSHCPTCKKNCTPAGGSRQTNYEGMLTRKKAAMLAKTSNQHTNPNSLKQNTLEQPQMPPTETNLQNYEQQQNNTAEHTNAHTNSVRQDDFLSAEVENATNEDHIRNLIAVTIQGRQAIMLEELERNISSRIERKLENTLAAFMERINLNDPIAEATNDPSRRQPTNDGREFRQPRPLRNTPIPNVSDRQSPLNPQQFNQRIDNLNFSDSLSRTSSNRIAQLIQSWDIKYDGSARLSFESFLYRLESQVFDTLGGNFNHLCENIQSLLVGDAKHWYWSYRRTVSRVTWLSFCDAIRSNFEEHKTDTEIKKTIRSRKQGPNESFDEYRNAIYKLTERLEIPLPERELVEILQRGLRPRIRQQLLYAPIRSVTELRRLCLRGESLLTEIAKTSQNTQTVYNRPTQRRVINEIQAEMVDNLDFDEEVAIEEVRRIATKKGTDM